MWSVLALCLGAAAAPIVEEDDDVVVVWADPLGPWDGTRWYVASETISAHNALDVVTTEGRFRASAWQVEAVLFCHIEHRKRFGGGGVVACIPEDVAIRVATDQSWQRPSDRVAVQNALDALAADVRQSAVRLRVHDAGDVRIRSEQSRTGELASRVLERALDAFHLDLPERIQSATTADWEDGLQWVTSEEPLLALDAVGESFGLETAVHHGNRFRDRPIIQSVAEAWMETVIDTSHHPGARGPGRDSAQERFQASWRNDAPPGPPEEHTLRSIVRLDGLAVFDPGLGFMTERVWKVQSYGALSTWRSGRLQLLGNEEDWPLGDTGQVAPPRHVRGDLPPWLPVDPALQPDAP
jgi:hypothetical protein